MRTRILLSGTIALVGLALLGAGCGGDDDDSSDGGSSDNSSGAYGKSSKTTSSSSDGGGAGATKLKLTADPGGALKFDKKSLTAKAGKVTIVMDNPSDVPHAVEVEGNGVEKETKTVTGASADVTVDLKAGKYEFYCPVDGHKEAGMEGTLTVN